MLNRTYSLALAIIMCLGTLGVAPLTTSTNNVQPLEEIVVRDTMLHLEVADTEEYDPW